MDVSDSIDKTGKELVSVNAASSHMVQVPLVGGSRSVTLVEASRTDDPLDLVALAQQIQRADELVRAVAGSQLTLIAEQIRSLQRQAHQVLSKAKRDADFHSCACNIVKRVGQTYYLYLRDSGQRYFSIMSLTDWGSQCPHQYLGSFRLEGDQSWTPLDSQGKETSDAMIESVTSQLP